MERSTSLSNLAAALSLAQAEMPEAVKDKVNPQFGSLYADLGSIIRTARPILAKHGLSVVQFVEDSAPGILAMSTMVLHTTGEYISAICTMPLGDKLTPQKYGSAITYARRYAFAAAIGIVSDIDDDGNESSQEPRQASTYQKSAAKISPEQAEILRSTAVKHKWNKAEVDSLLSKRGYSTMTELSVDDFDAFRTKLESKVIV